MQAFRDLLKLAESAHAAIMADLGSVDHDPEEIRAAEDVMQRARDALAETSCAGDYAEPWHTGPRYISTVDGRSVGIARRSRDVARIVACVNACAGIADPAGMVDCLRAVETWILDYVPHDIGGRSHHLSDVRAILNSTPRPAVSGD